MQHWFSLTVSLSLLFTLRELPLGDLWSLLAGHGHGPSGWPDFVYSKERKEGLEVFFLWKCERGSPGYLVLWAAGTEGEATVEEVSQCVRLLSVCISTKRQP